MPDHISRKELKHDKIKETLEHGAEAVYSHGTTTLLIVLGVVIAAAVFVGWHYHHERQTADAQAAFDAAMTAYSGRIGGAPDPTNVNEPSYTDAAARSRDAATKFTAVADKYPSTNPGKLARYYAALCFEDLGQHNQALEELQKISSSSDKELSALAQYQIAITNERSGKSDEAIKLLRALADKGSVLVPRPMILLELAGVLRQKNPQEAAGLYQQIKKEFPDSAVSEEADRGLDLISPKS